VAAQSGLTARFAADLAQLWPGEGRLGLAVSGGPDSLALLILAHAACPGRIEAATVDHGLRAESAEEAAMVARICGDLAIPHAVLPVRVPPGNMQDQARAARYAALGRWAADRGLAALATAHHADDQAETLLMRLNRGSGLAGLAGVRAYGKVPGTDLPLLRPLLGWRKADLREICDDAALAPVEDPSNSDSRFDRALMRQALEGADWVDVPALSRSAALLGEANEAVQFYLSLELERQVTGGEGEWCYRPAGPRLVRHLAVEELVRRLGGEPRGGQVADLIRTLEQGGKGTLAGVLADARPDGTWRFRREPGRATAAHSTG